jgi:hypothetical protein
MKQLLPATTIMPCFSVAHKTPLAKPNRPFQYKNLRRSLNELGGFPLTSSGDLLARFSPEVLSYIVMLWSIQNEWPSIPLGYDLLSLSSKIRTGLSELRHIVKVCAYSIVCFILATLICRLRAEFYIQDSLKSM